MYGVFGTSSVISAMSSATLYVNFSSSQCSVSVARFRDFAAHHGDEAPDDVAVLPERVEVLAHKIMWMHVRMQGWWCLMANSMPPWLSHSFHTSRTPRSNFAPSARTME